jgi:hypothetical protein
MPLTLTHEETKALHLFGVYDCHNAGQLLQREDFIRKLYRRRALSTHPDRAIIKGSDPDIMEKAFQNVNESYNILMQKIILQKGTIKNRPRKVKVQQQGDRKRKEETHSIVVGYYRGYFPEKKLRFAEFLYYNKKITWEQLVASLSWQFMNRPKLGEIAKEKGLLNEEQILSILRNKKSSQRFGLVAVKNGFITVDKCKEILSMQKSLGLPIGKYFLHERIFTMGELNKFLYEFKVHNNQHKRPPS